MSWSPRQCCCLFVPLGIPPSQQGFNFNGVELEDEDRPLAYYKVTNGSKLRLEDPQLATVKRKIKAVEKEYEGSTGPMRLALRQSLNALYAEELRLQQIKLERYM